MGGPETKGPSEDRVGETDPAGAKPPTSRFPSLPKTKLGKAAMWLMIAFIAMLFVLNVVGMSGLVPPGPATVAMIVYGWSTIAVGLASGVVALRAIIRERERSWAVWLPIAPFAFVLFLLLGELVSALVPALRH